MDKKTGFILGTAFIIASGLVYTLERLSAYIYWFAQINTGGYPTEPDSVALFDNLFTVSFLVIGIILIVLSIVNKDFLSKE